ncbi:MAG: nucleotidyltransferase family protein [Crocinitomicaceae bacterium]|nr:nucleotidyltransferase family protein [Crocinitomicaceae bacterium]MBK8926446.1 nucleotidyltransferase family protein [Crocinitomicaceae bacterium]
MNSQEYILSSIKKHKSELARYGVHNVGLFGSYAKGEQSSGSDIDILIDFDPKQENFDNFMAVCDILEKLFQNQKVEIVTKNGLSPYIGPSILREVMYV